MPISVEPSHGSAKIERPPPAGTIAPPISGSVLAAQRDVRAAARADAGHLGLVVQLARAQAVGPDAGRVDDRVGAHDELVAALGVADAHAAGAAVLLDQLGHLAAVGADGAEALGLGEDRHHEPRVVGLAVVEQVAGGGLAPRQRRQQLDDLLAGDDPVAVGAPVEAPRRRRRARGAGAACRPT